MTKYCTFSIGRRQLLDLGLIESIVSDTRNAISMAFRAHGIVHIYDSYRWILTSGYYASNQNMQLGAQGWHVSVVSTASHISTSLFGGFGATYVVDSKQETSRLKVD